MPFEMSKVLKVLGVAALVASVAAQAAEPPIGKSSNPQDVSLICHS